MTTVLLAKDLHKLDVSSTVEVSSYRFGTLHKNVSDLSELFLDSFRDEDPDLSEERELFGSWFGDKRDLDMFLDPNDSEAGNIVNAQKNLVYIFGRIVGEKEPRPIMILCGAVSGQDILDLPLSVHRNLISIDFSSIQGPGSFIIPTKNDTEFLLSSGPIPGIDVFKGGTEKHLVARESWLKLRRSKELGEIGYGPRLDKTGRIVRSDITYRRPLSITILEPDHVISEDGEFLQLKGIASGQVERWVNNSLYSVESDIEWDLISFEGAKLRTWEDGGIDCDYTSNLGVYIRPLPESSGRSYKKVVANLEVCHPVTGELITLESPEVTITQAHIPRNWEIVSGTWFTRDENRLYLLGPEKGDKQFFEIRLDRPGAEEGVKVTKTYGEKDFKVGRVFSTPNDPLALIEIETLNDALGKIRQAKYEVTCGPLLKETFTVIQASAKFMKTVVQGYGTTSLGFRGELVLPHDSKQSQIGMYELPMSAQESGQPETTWKTKSDSSVVLRPNTGVLLRQPYTPNLGDLNTESTFIPRGPDYSSSTIYSSSTNLGSLINSDTISNPKALYGVLYQPEPVTVLTNQTALLGKRIRFKDTLILRSDKEVLDPSDWTQVMKTGFKVIPTFLDSRPTGVFPPSTKIRLTNVGVTKIQVSSDVGFEVEIDDSVISSSGQLLKMYSLGPSRDIRKQRFPEGGSKTVSIYVWETSNITGKDVRLEDLVFTSLGEGENLSKVVNVFMSNSDTAPRLYPIDPAPRTEVFLNHGEEKQVKLYANNTPGMSIAGTCMELSKLEPVFDNEEYQYSNIRVSRKQSDLDNLQSSVQGKDSGFRYPARYIGGLHFAYPGQHSSSLLYNVFVKGYDPYVSNQGNTDIVSLRWQNMSRAVVMVRTRYLLTNDDLEMNLEPGLDRSVISVSAGRHVEEPGNWIVQSIYVIVNRDNPNPNKRFYYGTLKIKSQIKASDMLESSVVLPTPLTQQDADAIAPPSEISLQIFQLSQTTGVELEGNFSRIPPKSGSRTYRFLSASTNQPGVVISDIKPGNTVEWLGTENKLQVNWEDRVGNYIPKTIGPASEYTALAQSRELGAHIKAEWPKPDTDSWEDTLSLRQEGATTGMLYNSTQFSNYLFYFDNTEVNKITESLPVGETSLRFNLGVFDLTSELVNETDSVVPVRLVNSSNPQAVVTISGPAKYNDSSNNVTVKLPSNTGNSSLTTVLEFSGSGLRKEEHKVNLVIIQPAMTFEVKPLPGLPTRKTRFHSSGAGYLPGQAWETILGFSTNIPKEWLYVSGGESFGLKSELVYGGSSNEHLGYRKYTLVGSIDPNKTGNYRSGSLRIVHPETGVLLHEWEFKQGYCKLDYPDNMGSPTDPIQLPAKNSGTTSSERKVYKLSGKCSELSNKFIDSLGSIFEEGEVKDIPAANIKVESDKWTATMKAPNVDTYFTEYGTKYITEDSQIDSSNLPGLESTYTCKPEWYQTEINIHAGVSLSVKSIDNPEIKISDYQMDFYFLKKKES